MQASGMSEKAYFYPREGSTVYLSPNNVPTRISGKHAEKHVTDQSAVSANLWAAQVFGGAFEHLAGN
jgi:hypothetical protein